MANQQKNASLLFFLYLSMFMATFSVGIYNPLIPLYAKLLGATYMDLGVIGTVFALPYAILPAFIGSLTDKLGRKPFYVGGISLLTVIAILFIFASNVKDIILIRVLNGVAYSFLWPVAEPMIVDVTSIHERTRVLGRFSFFWALGFLLSPFFGGFIVEGFGFYPLFIVAMLIGLAASTVAFYGLIYKQEDEASHTKKVWIENPDSESLKGSGGLFPLYLTIVVYSIVIGIVFSIFPVYANSFNVSSFQIGILFTVFGVSRVIVFLNSENVSKLFGEKNSIILALITQIAALTLMASTKNLASFLSAMVLLGLSSGIISPITISIASKIAKKEKIGATLGSMESFVGLGMTVGPIVGGTLAEKVSIESPYIVTGILCLLPLAVLVKGLEKPKKG